LISELKVLKSNYDQNFDRIVNIEKTLNSLNDKKLKVQVEKFRSFEHLNKEKVTPFTLKLLKQTNKEFKLSEIKNLDGSDFSSGSDHSEYIRQHFANIYEPVFDESNVFTGCIEEFLGPEVLNHPVVKNSRLNISEKNKLDEPLSIAELDKALLEANKKSAPGIDGFGLNFIQKFWSYIREPLFKYAQCCFEKGELTNTFKSALIRLIPKKGDVSQIKNWRPISLLSNIYKILSRALNNRLKKIVDRVTSRAQKGFTNSRYLHEVLINVIESIAYCNFTGKKGVIISVDQAKAFDSINHKFLSECYRFFGFGENIINMLGTVGKNRQACVILDDGTTTKYFPLKCGRPQGEILSPIQYNFGNQILLFMVELCPEIGSIFNHFIGPCRNYPLAQNALEHNAIFADESNKETDKAEGFADDSSAITEREQKSVSTVKKVLTNFSLISGLQCNFDKSFLIPIGPEPDEPWLMDCGFNITNNFKLLGVQIDNKLTKLDSNFEKCYEKICGIIRYWERFNLSLAGRITVSKTFLIQQICHFGCILMPGERLMNLMQTAIDNYCIGKLNVSKDRLYISPEAGGLGLINLQSFLVAQQVIWLKRAAESTRDNWRVNACEGGFGNCLATSQNVFRQEKNPILFSLCKSWDTFVSAYYSLEGNIFDSFIMNNPLICRSPTDPGLLDEKFWSSSPFADKNKLAFLRFRNCFGPDNKILSYNEFLNVTNINISPVTYVRLHTALDNFRKKFIPVPYEGKSVGVDRFLASFKKGSKRVRQIITYKSNTQFSKIEPVTEAFFTICNLRPEPDQIKLSCFWLWSNSQLSNDFRDFLYKFYYNKLGLNSRIAHFTDRHKGCTFCTIVADGLSPVENETFMHLFINCPSVRHVHEEVNRALEVQPLVTDLVWLGLAFDDKFYRLFVLLVQFEIWKCKLNKTIPRANFILGEAFYKLDNVVRSSYSLTDEFTSTNSLLSRLWRTLRRARW
jgi:Reverse transcriptase (RNA-dependent DNA polymerase)